MGRIDPERQVDLDRLYAAVDDEAAFKALPDVIAAECGARSGMMLYEDPDEGVSIPLMNYWPAEACARYFAEFTEIDPWIDAYARHGPDAGVIRRLDDALPPEAFTQTAIFNELCRPLGDDTARCMGSVLDVGRRRWRIGVHRAARDMAYDDGDVARLERVHNHLKRILRLRGLLAVDRAPRIQAMLDASDRAMLLVDRRLRIDRASAAAIALLDRRDGLAVSQGAIAVDHAGARAALLALVRDTIDGVPPAHATLLCPRRSGPASYRILVLPGEPHAPGRAVLTLDDPARSPASGITAFAHAYRLSPAEAALAAGIADGETLREIAERRGVAIGTVRSQLKGLFARTGTSRQAELVRLFAGLPRPAN